MGPCECGCGTLVPRRFVRGHSSRVRVLSAEHRRAISDGLRGNANRQGKPQSERERAKRSAALRGERNGFWKGGSYVSSQGYRYVLVGDHYELEHRVVMERHLGRPLLDSEIVHHKNGDKLDNPPENLELTTRPEHIKLHGTQPTPGQRPRGANHWTSDPKQV